METVERPARGDQTSAPESPAVEYKPFLVRLPPELHRAFRALAFATDTSMNSILVGALTEYITAHSAEKFEIVLERVRRDYGRMADRLTTAARERL